MWFDAEYVTYPLYPAHESLRCLVIASMPSAVSRRYRTHGSGNIADCSFGVVGQVIHYEREPERIAEDHDLINWYCGGDSKELVG